MESISFFKLRKELYLIMAIVEREARTIPPTAALKKEYFLIFNYHNLHIASFHQKEVILQHLSALVPLQIHRGQT